MNAGVAFALFFAGIGLVIAEIFVVSFGVLTLAAVACFVGGCVSAFYADTTFGFLFSLGNLIVVPLFIWMIIKHLPNTGIGKKIIRTKPEPEEKTVADQVQKLKHFMGRKGVAISMLRPAGVAEFDGVRVDVATEGVFLEPGTAVEVFEVSGNRLLVRKVEQ